MLPRLMRRKPEAELLKAAWPTCAPSLPAGRYCGPYTSGRFAASSVAMSHRLDCQLPNVEALL
jgi:hypothetical protein